MSQVRKLLDGGTSGKRVGSITIGGTKYEATPEFIRDFSDYLSSYGQAAAPLSFIISDLKNGLDLDYDTVGSVLTGSSGYNSGYDANRSRFAKSIDATFNNGNHKFRNALQLLKGYTPTSSVTGETNKTNNDLLKIFANPTYFKYTQDENGKWVLLKDSSENSMLNQRLDYFTDYLPDEEAGKKKYNLADWSDEKMAAIRSLYANTPNWEDRIKAIRDRAAMGPEYITEEDKAFLKHFNIFQETDAETQARLEEEKAKKEWAAAGWSEDMYKRFSPIAHLADDGTIELNEGANWDFDLQDLTGSNIFFNDDFFRSKYAANGGFDPLRNLTLYGNKLYALNSPALARLLNYEGGYNQLKEAGDWAGAEKLIRTRFTDKWLKNPGSLSAENYAPFFIDNPNFRFNDVTGLVKTNNPDDLLNGNQIVEYVDLKDNGSGNIGPYRFYNYKYALLDRWGNWLRDIDPAEINNIDNGSERPNGLTTYKRVVGTTNQDYEGRYYQDILSKSGKATGFRVYYDPKNKNDIILHMPRISASGLDEDVDIKLPADLAQILLSNDKLWDNVTSDAQQKLNFQKLLSQLTQSWFRRTTSDVGRNLMSYWLRNDRNKWKKLGFEDAELDNLVQIWKDSYRNRGRVGNREDRRDEYVVYSPYSPTEIAEQQAVYRKQGGTIRPLPQKLQKGSTVSGGTTNAIGVTEVRTSNKNRTPEQPAGILEIGNKNWTENDTKDLVALAFDLSGLGFAFNPATTGVAAATGAAGSLMRFSANRGRDTKGAGWQLGLDLTMDAASLIPGLKAVKESKVLAKALPTLFKAASVFGLGTAFENTLRKAEKGEKFTVRDMSILVNGITSVVNLKHSGGFGKKKIKINEEVKPITIKGKTENAPEVKLPADKISEDMSAEEFSKLVVKEAKKADANKDLSDEAILAKYDISKYLSTIKKEWAPGWSPKKWLNKNEVKGFKGRNGKERLLDLTSEEGQNWLQTEEGKQKISTFGRWWRSVGEEQMLYNMGRVGKQPDDVNKKNFIETTTGTKKVTKISKKTDVNAKNKDLGEKNGWRHVESKFRFSNDPSRQRIVIDGKELAPSVPQSEPGNINGFRVGENGWTVRVGDQPNPDRNLPVVMREVPKRKIVRGKDITHIYEPTFYTRTARRTGRRFNKAAYREAVARRNALIDFQNKLWLARPKFILPIHTRYQDQQPAGLTPYPYWLKEGGTIKKMENGDPVKKNVKGQPITTSSTSSTVGGDSSGIGNYPGGKHWITNSIGYGIEGPINLDPKLLGNTIGYGIQSAYVDKMLRNAKLLRAPRYQALTLNAPAFTDTTNANALREQAKTAAFTKPIGSNAITNVATQILASEEARKLNTQADQVESQAYGAYNQGVNQIESQNAKYAVDTANNQEYADSSLHNNIIAETAKALANKAEISDVYQNFLTKYWDDINTERMSLAAENDSRIPVQMAMTDYINEMTALNNEYPTTESRNTNDYLIKKQRIENKFNAARVDASNLARNYALPSLARIPLNAKGGKVGRDSKVTYSRDPYPDLLLQNAKSAHEVIPKLSEDVIAIIKELKPIYVSK